ncbi:MAG: hypothetical protein IKX35_04780 [Bacteroidales bacterium]|nr:hypothetical protein [Bacteroidales bacterium]
MRSTDWAFYRSGKTTLKTENRNEENRRQTIVFIADNGISDSKTVSKAIGLKPSRTRDYLKQLVDMAGFFGPTAKSNFVELVDYQKNVVAESLER